MKNKVRTFLIFCGFFITTAFADVNTLNTLLQNFNSLQANFSETVVSQETGSVTSKGVLYIKKPNQFRFETLSPNKTLFISDGKKMWNIEPDLEQVIVGPLSQNLSSTPLLLLSGNATDLNSIFTIQMLDATHYALTPKSKDSLIEKIVLGFNDKGVVSDLAITNSLGQTSHLTLTDVQINSNLAPALFKYSPPAGMDVLQQ